jgi:hypothetical protein
MLPWLGAGAAAGPSPDAAAPGPAEHVAAQPGPAGVPDVASPAAASAAAATRSQPMPEVAGDAREQADAQQQQRGEARQPVAAADLAAFSGVWQVQPRPRPGRGPGGARAGAGRGDAAGPRAPGPRGDEEAAEARIRARMTPAGQAAFDSVDLRQHPANNCVSPGLPSIAMMPNLQEWSLLDGRLRIFHESYETERHVRIDGSDHAPGVAHTPAGDAIGWMDGNTLVVHTAQLTAAIGALARNAPGSASRSVTERYRLSGDGQSMVGELVVEDPEFLREPLHLTVRLRRAEAGTRIERFGCDVEAARRHLD